MAEWIETLKRLDLADDEARQTAAGLLGLNWQKLQAEISGDAVGVKEEHPREGESKQPRQFADTSAFWDLEDASPPEEIDPVDEEGVTMLSPDRVDSLTVEAISGDAFVSANGPLASSLPAHLRRPVRPPLLQPSWFRGIMSALLTTRQESRTLDWRFVERRLQAGRPIEGLPWRQHFNLKRGVQVLLDYSESMQPFWQDETMLVSSLTGLLGREAVRSWAFRRLPDSQSGWRWTWSAKRPPLFSAGTPLLLVSDFGIGGDHETTPSLWQTVLCEPRSLQCPVAALIPAPRKAWPDWLGQVVSLALVWDRETSPQGVRRCHRSLR